MKKRLIPAIIALLIVPAGADILWTGAVNDDIFDEANWDLTGSAVTVVDPNVTIDDNVVIANAIAPVIVPDLGGQIRFQVGDGFTLTIDGSELNAVGNDGIGGVPGTSIGPTVNLINSGKLGTFFITNRTHLDLDGTSSASLGGGATPINGSTIDLTAGCVLECPDETVTDFINEHLSKISVDDVAAVIDSNMWVVSDGAAGSVARALPQDWTSYCLSVPNSTSSIAQIAASGTSSVSRNDFMLSANPVPNQLGIFFYGPNQMQAVFGNGFRCVSGRLVRLPVVMGQTNSMTYATDWTAPPSIWGTVDAGETWNFQLWFQDPNAGGAQHNLTDALEVTFSL
ncbi:MAG: hypothetical protein ACI841_004586 [Planctomycetota bacterium]|jgi:hypothetical protein